MPKESAFSSFKQAFWPLLLEYWFSENTMLFTLDIESYSYGDFCKDLSRGTSSLLQFQSPEAALVLLYIYLTEFCLRLRKDIHSFPQHCQHSKATSPGGSLCANGHCPFWEQSSKLEALGSLSTPFKEENTSASWTNNETCLTSNDEMLSINTPYLPYFSFQDWFTTEIFVSLKFKYMEPHPWVSVVFSATESSMDFINEGGH